MKKKYLSLLVLPLALVSCGGEEITLEEAKKIFAENKIDDMSEVLKMSVNMDMNSSQTVGEKTQSATQKIVSVIDASSVEDFYAYSFMSTEGSGSKNSMEMEIAVIDGVLWTAMAENGAEPVSNKGEEFTQNDLDEILANLSQNISLEDYTFEAMIGDLNTADTSMTITKTGDRINFELSASTMFDGQFSTQMTNAKVEGSVKYGFGYDGILRDMDANATLEATVKEVNMKMSSQAKGTISVNEDVDRRIKIIETK